MRAAKWALVLLALGPLLSGCANFWQAPPTTASTTTTLTSKNFYVLNVATNQIAGYNVAAGTLTKLASSPYSVPAVPITLTIAQNNDFLYVSTVAGIYVYSISSTGALTLGNGGAVISTSPATSMAVDPVNGNWLIEAASGTAAVYAIAINSSTGVPTSSQAEYLTLPASSIQQLAIAPNDTDVFVAMGTGGTAVIPFTPANTNPFSPATIILPAGSGSGGSALSVAVDPQERVFYIGETVATTGSNTGGIRVYNYNTLKEVTGSPYSSQGLSPRSILPISTGDYVYVANYAASGNSSGLVAGFSVSSTNSVYSLTALTSTFAAGTNPVALAEDSSDQFVFAVSSGGGPDLIGYVFDTSKAGNLDSVVTSATGTDPVQASAVAATH